MPRISKMLTLEITPEQFVNSCSDVELQELLILADTKLHTCRCITDLAKARCSRNDAGLCDEENHKLERTLM